MVLASTDASLLASRTGYRPSAGFRSLVAIREDGSTAGMVGFDGWTPNSVHMHVALGVAAAARPLLRPAFAEAFADGRSMALGSVRSSNARSLRLAIRLGFREVYRVKDGWAAGEDMVLFEMRREECRWL